MVAASPKPYDVLITDIDGVLTDGCFIYTADGKMGKLFGAHDADGARLFRSIGIKIIAVTADNRGYHISQRRLDDMGIQLHLVKEAGRAEAVAALADDKSYGFIGDGYYDIGPIRNAAIGYCPLSAPDVVKSNASHVLPVNGGSGVLLAAFEHYLSVWDNNAYSNFKEGRYLC